MSDTVLSVENLSKSYRLGQISTGTLARDMTIWWAKMRGKTNPYLVVGQADNGQHDGETIWALKNINLSAQQGQALGIIGRNGAGKSTLLKILSEVTAPTSGEVRLRGRIASLLEVGTGFHPDLTGRENIYLNGAILGMSRTEIKSKFDAIVDFSGIDKFIDTPVKRYSSGMYVRLAFAVAAHLEPEILVLDEVLAVGDVEFQKKCLGKMGDVTKEGRTVLFVTHNMSAVQTLCQRGVWLEGGQMNAQGTITEIVSAYLHSGLIEGPKERIWDDLAHAPGNETVRLHRIAVQPEDGRPEDILTMQTPLRIEVEYWNLQPGKHLHATLHVYNEQGILAFTTGGVPSPDPAYPVWPPVGLFRSVCHIPGNFLNSGIHRIKLMLIRGNSADTYEMEEAIMFDVVDKTERNFAWYGKEPGVVYPRLPWEVKYLGDVAGQGLPTDK